MYQNLIGHAHAAHTDWSGLYGRGLVAVWDVRAMWLAGMFQMMVQRTLAARSISHAQGGTLFAGYLKLLPIFLLVIPGMISRVLFTGNLRVVIYQ